MHKFWIAVCIGLMTYGFSHGQAQLGGLGTSGSQQSSLDARQEAPGASEILGAAVDLLIDSVHETFSGEGSKESRWSSNLSPRDTVYTFVENMHLHRYDGRGYNEVILSTLPTGYDVDSSETLALHSVFERLGDIPPSDLPAKGAAILERLNHFEVFPYAVDHAWLWQRLDGPPKGSIVLSRQADGSWRFSESTLAGATQLLKSLQAIPPSYANENIQQARRIFLPSVNQTTPWRWLVACTGLMGSIFIARTARRRLVRTGNRLEDRTKPIIGSLFRSIATSLSIIIGTLVFVLACTFVELPPALESLYWKCIQTILLVAFIWVIFGMTDLISTMVRHHIVEDNDEYAGMTVTIIQRVIHSFFFVMIAVFILENVFDFSIGALITGLGILGLALSLAGKETAQNLFGAVSIFVNRPFVVGDWVEFKGQIGEIDDVRMQATHIRLLTGEMLIVPNMQFISNEVENLAMRKYLRREMDIAVPYATEPEKIDDAIERINEILRSDEIVSKGKCNLDERPPVVSFSKFGDYYLNLKVYYWYFIGDEGEEMQRNSERGWFSYLEHCTLVNRAILNTFNGEDIKFAFPTQTVALGKADEGTT